MSGSAPAGRAFQAIVAEPVKANYVKDLDAADEQLGKDQTGDRAELDSLASSPWVAKCTTTAQVASRGIPGSVSRLFGSGLADVELVRRQQPLPETADELCAVAQSTGAPEGAVLLGEKASETAIKTLCARLQGICRA